MRQVDPSWPLAVGTGCPVSVLTSVLTLCDTEKEWGLHSGNIKKADGTTEARKAERDLWIEGKVAALSKAQVGVGGR